MSPPKFALVRALGKRLLKREGRHVPLEVQEALGAASPGSERGSVWHLCGVASKARRVFRPLRMWAPGRGASSASWLHPSRGASTSRSRRRTLVLSLGSFPSSGRRELACKSSGGWICSPSSVSEGTLMPDGRGEPYRVVGSGQW